MKKLEIITTTANRPLKEIHKVSARLFPPYTKRVAEVINTTGVNQSEFTRLAIMMAVDGGLIGANERLARIEEQQIWLRKELSEAFS